MKDDKVMTQQGLQELKAELEKRKTVTREEIAEKLNAASEQGDLSENAAYKAAMEDKEFNENRIEELEGMIADAVVMKGDSKDSTAGLGEKVVVKRKSDGAKREYILVGESEADPSEFKISVGSPIGQALLGKDIGDSVSVDMPNGTEEFEVVAIE
ncbi:transcription elongation factor GreA [Candidatus Dojkabacteria bacterium]|nr:transcription elongation factor GreA [Candidatus Dojkabacteria bacterium]